MAKKNAAARRRTRAARTERQTQPRMGASRTAPVAVARAPTVQPAGSLRQKGSDRLGHIEDISQYDTGATVFAAIIEPGIAERLGKLAGLFQRIRYNSLRVEVRSQTSTSTGGGYVVGFLRDPDAYSPQAQMLDHVSSLTGSRTGNWWQSTVIDIGRTPDLMYTNNVTSKSKELKHVSPGVLVLVCDGKATASGGMTIILHWDVSLSEPALNPPETPKTELQLQRDYGFWDFGTDQGSTQWVAMVNDTADTPGWTTAEDLGVSPGTIWRTRPYSFVCEGPRDNFFKVVNTQYVIVYASDKQAGYVRPAVKITPDRTTKLKLGKIVDAGVAFGPFSYYEYGPAFAGDHIVFHAGDIWTQVDALGQPIDIDLLKYSEVSRMRTEGLLAPLDPPGDPVGLHGPRGKIAHLEAKLSGKSIPNIPFKRQQRDYIEEHHAKEDMKSKTEARREKREVEFRQYLKKLKELHGKDNTVELEEAEAPSKPDTQAALTPP